MNKLRLLDLFSGIGGFSLGLERTGGFETVAFCEWKLEKHADLQRNFPGVPIYIDVKEVSGSRLRSDGISIDAICGGFPCQDISFSGKGEGLSGARSSLFFEVARLIRELRPEFVLLENVSALLDRGMGEVLGALATLGYDAEWHCLSAADLGQVHGRDRIWILAYPDGKRRFSLVEGIQNVLPSIDLQASYEGRSIAFHLLPDVGRMVTYSGSDIGRNDHGLSRGMVALEGYGNAVVPQIPELIGRAYLDAIGWRKEAA